MKIKKVISGVVLTGLSAGTSFANETNYGIGVAIDDAIKIYLPITSNDFIIEPSFFIRSDKSETETDQGASWGFDGKAIELGIGFFRNKKVYENTTMYYGARVGYSKVKTTFSNSDVAYQYTSSDSDKRTGYFIAPTLGMEYFISANFSLGLDVSVQYQKLDGETVETNNLFSETRETETEITSYETQAEIIVRYRF